MLAPESVHAPVPVLVTLPPPESTPEKLVVVLLPPADSAALPSVMLPVPAMEPTVSA